jgi:hypothetical protein
MKQTLLVMKIGALLAVIFATGIWVGRNTVPAEAVDTAVVPPAAAENDARQSGRWTFAFRRYAKALDLTDEQKVLLEPLFKQADEELSLIPRFSKDRQRVVEVLHQRMEPHLNPQQKAEAEKIRQDGIELLEEARTR